MSLLVKQQEMRKARINLILNTLKALETVEYNKILGLMSINYGFSSDLTKKYLKELADCDFIIIDNGLVSVTEQTIKLQNPEVKKAEEEVKELAKEITQYQ